MQSNLEFSFQCLIDACHPKLLVLILPRSSGMFSKVCAVFFNAQSTNGEKNCLFVYISVSDLYPRDQSVVYGHEVFQESTIKQEISVPFFFRLLYVGKH